MPENLLGNAGFEFDSDADGLADGLERFGTPTATRVAALTGSAGAWAQRVVVASGSNHDVRFLPFPVAPATQYTLSVLAHVTALSATPAGAFVLKVEWLDGTGAAADYAYAVVAAVDGAPVRRSVTATSAAAAVAARVIFAVEGGGTVVLDDAQLELGGTVGAWSEPEPDWIMRAVMTAADGTNAAGGIGWGTAPVSAVRPYEASFAALGLASAARRFGVRAYVDAVWGWLTWFRLNQEADGTVWDYGKAGGAFVRETAAPPAAPTLQAFGTGGTLGAATYSYRVVATSGVGVPTAAGATGVTTPGPAATAVVASGTTNRVVVSWAGVDHAYGYRVYGRTSGAELLLAEVGFDVLTWTDTGAGTPSGALPATNTCYYRDSTDSYAGLFLLACRAAWMVNPDAAALAPLATAIGLAVSAVELTQDADGLTWAKPEYHVKYLMDQTETLGGLRAAVWLAEGPLADATLAARARAARDANQAGVESLWNAATPVAPAYDWAKHGGGAHQATAWGTPGDALQQAWAVVFRMSDDQARLVALMGQFLASFPDWDDPAATGGWDALPAVGMQATGYAADATAGITAILAYAASTGRAWDYNPMKASWITLARHGSGDLVALESGATAEGDMPYVFTRQANGETILATDINELQVAIEDISRFVNAVATTKTAAYTATADDDVIPADAAGGTFTVTLPTAAGRAGKRYTVKKTTATNTVNIGTTSAQTIDGAAPPVALTANKAFRTLVSDGAGWIVVASG